MAQTLWCRLGSGHGTPRPPPCCGEGHTGTEGLTVTGPGDHSEQSPLRGPPLLEVPSLCQAALGMGTVMARQRGRQPGVREGQCDRGETVREGPE